MKGVIKYIKHSDLDVSKYDACIKQAQNSKIYAYSWYLDIVADNWDVLVLDDYKAVMPIPWRRKYFIKYVYNPFWVAELGVFFGKEINIDDYLELFGFFIKKMNSKFSQIDILLNSVSLTEDINLPIKVLQKLDMSKDYRAIFRKYKKGRKSDISKTRKNNFQINWNDKVKRLIVLHKENVGKRLKYFKERDYVVLEKLIEEIIKRKKGQIVSAYDNDKLLASMFIIDNNSVVIGLVAASDLNYRNNGVTSFLYDTVIKKYSNMNYSFDFAGSSVESIAEFFRSFGAEDIKRYHILQYHLLYRLKQISIFNV